MSEVYLTTGLREHLASCIVEADNGFTPEFRDELIQRLYRVPTGSVVPEYDGHIEDASDLELVRLGIDNFDVNVEDFS